MIVIYIVIVFKIEGCFVIKIIDFIYLGKKIGIFCIVVKFDEFFYRYFIVFNIVEELVYKLL